MFFSFLKSAVDIKKTNYQGFNFFFFLGNRCCNQLSLNREPLVYVLKKKIRHSINNSGKLGLFGRQVCYDLLMVAFDYHRPDMLIREL